MSTSRPRHATLFILVLSTALALSLPASSQNTPPDSPPPQEPGFLEQARQEAVSRFWRLMETLRIKRGEIKASRLHALAESKTIGVPEVVDGDTLTIGGESIRLWGIDAPELDQTCRRADGASYPCGAVAKERLSSRINHQTLHCEHMDTDAYGRKVSRCLTQGGNDVAAWMINEGLAKAYVTYTHTYISFEDHARRTRRGFWRSGEAGFDDPATWRTR